jgi:hypothetical protein
VNITGTKALFFFHQYTHRLQGITYEHTLKSQKQGITYEHTLKSQKHFVATQILIPSYCAT